MKKWKVHLLPYKIIDEEGNQVACVEDENDAALVAAAPKILKALEDCAERMAIAAAKGVFLNLDEPSLVEAIDAIDQAKGQ